MRFTSFEQNGRKGVAVTVSGALRGLLEGEPGFPGSLQELEMQHSETWSDYQRVKAELEAAYRQSSALAESQSDPAQQAMPENRLASLTKLRESIQNQLNSLELRAPSDGVVANVRVSRGDVLKAGEPAVIMLEQDDSRAFLFFPPSAQGKLKVGQVVPAHTSAGVDYPLRIEKIYPRMESRSAQSYSELNAPDNASLVAEAVPADGGEFPDALNSGTPIYGRVPRWSLAGDIEKAVAAVGEFFNGESTSKSPEGDEQASAITAVQ